MRRMPTERARARFQPAVASLPPDARNLWEHAGNPRDRIFGSVVHAVLHQALTERLEKGRPRNPRDDVDAVLAIFEKRWETDKGFFGTGPEQQQWHDRAALMLGRYAASDDFRSSRVRRYQVRDAAGNPVGTPRPMLEFPFRVDAGKGIVLVGRFDRVDDRGGRPVVIDYKTGAPRSMTALRHDHQMLLYAAAIADLTGASAVTCEIHWLQTGTRSTLHFAGRELQRARFEAARYVKQLQQSQLYGTPPPSPHPLERPGPFEGRAVA